MAGGRGPQQYLLSNYNSCCQIFMKLNETVYGHISSKFENLPNHFRVMALDLYHKWKIRFDHSLTQTDVQSSWNLEKMLIGIIISAKFENPPITSAIKSYGPLFIQNNVKFALSALQLKQMLSDLH